MNELLMQINRISCRLIIWYLIIGLIIAAFISTIWFIIEMLNPDSVQDLMDTIIEDYDEVDLHFKSTVALWGFVFMTLILFWPFCIYVAIRK